ncbi:hypothetical protein ACFL07_00990 [Pseudomonadota bacterium]
MNDNKRFILTTLNNFTSDLREGLIRKSIDTDNASVDHVCLFGQFPHTKSSGKEEDHDVLVIEIESKFDYFCNRSVFAEIPVVYITKIFVESSKSKENLDWQIGQLKNVPTDQFTTAVLSSEASDQEVSSTSIVESDAAEFERDKKITRLASTLAIGLSKFRTIRDDYNSNFDFSTYCINSWLVGGGLSDSSYQKKYRSYCESFDKTLSEMTGKPSKILKLSKYTFSPGWQSLIDLVSKVSPDSLALDSSLDPQHKKKRQQIDDIIFCEALNQSFEYTVHPGTATKFFSKVLENSIQQSKSPEIFSQLSSFCTKYLQQGIGLEDFIKRFPELRKTTALLIFLGNDNLEDFGRLQNRIETYKKHIGANGYWACMVLYGLRNGFPGLLQAETASNSIVPLFKFVHSRLIVTKAELETSKEEFIKPFDIYDPDVLRKVSNEGAYVVQKKEHNDTANWIRYFPEQDRVYRALFSRLSKHELHSKASAIILEHAHQLGLEKWPLTDAINIQLKIKNRKILQQNIERTSVSFEPIPSKDVTVNYEWADWEAFLSLILSKDPKSINRVKRLVRESSCIWEKVLKDMDK